jgi:diamine N-acetyltransferase
MWALDTGEGSHWIGGFLIDHRHQRRGHGRAAVGALVEWLRREQGATSLALSYHPDNVVAERLYTGSGFAATGEEEEGELIARRPA